MDIADDAIIVSVKAIDIDDPYDIIESNRTFIEALFREGLEPDEVAADALKSYYVDFYRDDVKDGGFSQFVYNTGWDDLTITLLRQGLEEMGAKRNLQSFNKAAAVVEQMHEIQLDAFLCGEYFGDNEDRDSLSAFDEELVALFEEEDLIELNSRWLKSHPKLVAVTREEADEEIQRRVNRE